MTERIWLTWETQRRNRTTSAALGARLYELDYRLPQLPRWIRASVTTLRILRRERPRLLFAQNPSLLLALLAAWYGRLSGCRTVIDAHNGGVFPFSGRSGWRALLSPLPQALARHVMRQASLTLVSNAALAAYVDQAGGRGFVLPDPLPRFAPGRPVPLEGELNVLFICTWADDEPYLEVLRAARELPPSTRIYVTGRNRGQERALGEPVPPNVTLTGFVPEQRFIELLAAADVIMDLTTLDDCLVCGAYEAVAMGKPVVLSDSRALREYFHKGAVFTRNDAASIASALERALDQRERLAAQVRELRRELEESWNRRRLELEAVLAAPYPAGRSARQGRRAGEPSG